MSTTKHLDTAIAILGGGKSCKSRRKDEIVLTDLGDKGVAVQVNGRQVQVAPDMRSAEVDASRLEQALKKRHRKEAESKHVAPTAKVPLFDTEEAVMDAAIASQRARPVVAQTQDGQYALCSRRTARKMGWSVLCRIWGG
jgi:hypothetical protein